MNRLFLDTIQLIRFSSVFCTHTPIIWRFKTHQESELKRSNIRSPEIPLNKYWTLLLCSSFCIVEIVSNVNFSIQLMLVNTCMLVPESKIYFVFFNLFHHLFLYNIRYHTLLLLQVMSLAVTSIFYSTSKLFLLYEDTIITFRLLITC
jgi:hypothetical protein